MSLWHPDSLEVWLSGTSAALEAANLPGEVAADGADFRWEAALENARAAAASRPRPNSVSFKLGSPWVRFQIIPWEPAFAAGAARRAYVEQCFLETYGESVRQWQVSLSETGFGMSALACAVERRVLSDLVALASSLGRRIAGIEPGLMTLFEQSKSRIGATTYWFVVQESFRQTLLLVVDDIPRLVKSLPVGMSTLGILLDREWSLAGFEIPSCPVYLVSLGRQLARPDPGRWRLEGPLSQPTTNARRPSISPLSNTAKVGP